jgi:hypothetical protein
MTRFHQSFFFGGIYKYFFIMVKKKGNQNYVIFFEKENLKLKHGYSLIHNVISSTPRHEQEFELTSLVPC